jgi:hypothetical protein
VKTDRRDSVSLARFHRAGGLRAIHILREGLEAVAARVPVPRPERQSQLIRMLGGLGKMGETLR